MQKGGVPSAENSKNNQDGAFEVKDGCVKIYDPVGNGFPAVILPDPFLSIKVNNIEINKPQKVFAADKIEVIPRVEEIPGKIEVELGAKKFSAKIKVMPHLTIKRKLKDMPRQHENKFAYEEEKIYENKITLAEARQALSNKGVIFGIDYAVLEKVVKEADGTWHEVARGKEAKKGRDGYVELLFEPEITVPFSDGDELSRVDYKEKVRIPFVEKGDKIAIIHPPVLGEPGCLVTGDPIQPPVVKGAMIKCKDGCELDKNGTLVFAMRAGRPVVEGIRPKKFSVLPLYIHTDDVDLKSGNIRFNGDLKITGNIVEGMTVESQGNLEVQGNTAGARIIAGNSAIFINNLINSHVIAGGLKNIYDNMLPLLQEIEKSFEVLKQSFKQLQETLSKRGKKIHADQTGQLIKLLVEQKHGGLLNLIETLQQSAKEAVVPVPAQLLDIINEVNGYFLEEFKKIKNEQQLEEVVRKISSARSLVENKEDIRGDVLVSYVQNSIIETSGPISITGTGSYNSHFKTSDSVNITGVFRGGEIRAQKNIFIGEAGSPGLQMKQGEIHLSADSEARFRKVYENLVLYFGKRAYKFDATREMVKVYYDHKEDMIKLVNLV